MNPVGRDSVEPYLIPVAGRSGLDGVSPHRSWSKCAVEKPWKLSMNRPRLVLDWPTRFRGRGRERGGVGSWCQCAVATVEAFQEPGRLGVVDPRSGPRLCEAQRFMVPMRDSGIVEAFHEPDFGRD